MTAVNDQTADLAANGVIDISAASKDRGTRLLNSAEVAEMIRVPEATLRYWRHIGIGPRSFKMGPRRVLYLAEDVTAWVATQYADQR
jgi:predicted DNA-binding transcriptional regulator AlpA